MNFIKRNKRKKGRNKCNIIRIKNLEDEKERNEERLQNDENAIKIRAKKCRKYKIKLIKWKAIKKNMRKEHKRWKKLWRYIKIIKNIINKLKVKKEKDLNGENVMLINDYNEKSD